MHQYIDAKVKDLRELGCSSLTTEHVEEQTQYVIEGRRPLDIIGKLIESDNVREVNDD